MSPRSARPTMRRVALLIEASRAYARGLVRGIAQYNRDHQHWALYYTPRGLDDPPPAWLRSWEGEGILARINDRRLAQAVRRKGIPVVELRRAWRQRDVPSIGPDDAAVARLGAEHLRHCGFAQFGFVALPRGAHPAMDVRTDAFVAALRAEGRACSVLHVTATRPADFANRLADQIFAWLRKLPKPVGIMACNDDLALLVLDTCRRLRAVVPDEVAVLGVGNDECLCDVALPPLSSVDLDPQRIGYEAAALLDRMMAGQRCRPSAAAVPPRGIVARASTDVLAIADPDLARAVRYVREHACGPIRVGDVLRAACMSRARLEPRFKQLLGRTIHQEIDRLRIARVQELLRTTAAPLKRIAAQAGYRYPEYMMRVFREATGKTPSEYRAGFRHGARAES